MIKNAVAEPDNPARSEEDKFHISADVANVDDRIKVLNYSNTFAIFDRWGDIHPLGKKIHGIYHQGTRFINRLELRLNDQKPVLLSSSINEDNEILSVDLTNPFLSVCNIQENIIHISRTQFIRDGSYYEEISFVNYGEIECTVNISLAFGGDFTDIFEIRGMKRTVNPNKPVIEQNENALCFHYKGLDNIDRTAEIILPENIIIQNNKGRLSITLSPQAVHQVSYSIFFRASNQKKETLQLTAAKDHLQQELKTCRGMFADIFTDNEQFNHWLDRSRADLISLLANTPYGRYPYAGVPWYNTAFGRDG